MKRLPIIISIAIFTAIMACSSSKTAADTEESSPKEALRARLQSVADSGKTIFGMHDATVYGHTWKWEEGRSDVKDVCGDYPGVCNWDLGWVERGRQVELDSVPFDMIRRQVAANHKRGGINTFSWHLHNPKTMGSAWDTVSCVKEIVTPGTPLNDTMRVWIGRAADMIASMKDEKGNAIPVVFRPWHEHTGKWFWWGHAEPEDFKALFRMTREVFDEKGVDNVLWAYSPDRVDSSEKFFECYPGDEYIDILGTDLYDFTPDDPEGYKALVRRQLGYAAEHAKKTGQLVALTECGANDVPNPDWWDQVLAEAVKGTGVCYLTVWRNAWDIPEQVYGVYPGHPAEKSFLRMKSDPSILFCSDLNNY